MSFRIFTFVCLVLNARVFGKKEKIIGGTPANSADFLYQAVLQQVTNDNIICGGAIIGHFHILTTASCVISRNNSITNIKIIVGNTISPGLSGITFMPNRIYVHPAYATRTVSYQPFRNDIAVIRINGYIGYYQFQNKIKLPVRDIINNDLGILSGWGSTTYPLLSFPNVLHTTWFRVINNLQCRLVNPRIYNDQFCAFRNSNVRSCTGDGGSPLVSLDRLIGLVSLNNQCGSGVPNIYTNVYFHIDFIKSVVDENLHSK